MPNLKNYFRKLKQRNKLICYWLVRMSRSPGSFEFRGKTCRYFWHRYNATWRNERAVEIPIAREFIAESRGGNVLEVGNVLSHYGPVQHDVLDKYEKADHVVNEDVCTFKPGEKYDLIVSISTLEHVGWDEEPQDPKKSLEAFGNLQNLLVPGGKIVATIPLGYNPFLDESISQGKIAFSRRFYLKRDSHRNQWREVSSREVENPHYDKASYVAHELFVGIIEKP